MRGPFGSIEPYHAMSNQESTRGADAKKLFVRSDFQAVGSATHEQKDIFDQEVTKAFFLYSTICEHMGASGNIFCNFS